jgi:hypothetical protein
VASEWGLDFHLQKRLRHHNMLGQLGFPMFPIKAEINGRSMADPTDGGTVYSYHISLAICWRWDNHQSLGSSQTSYCLGGIIRPWQPWKMSCL